MGWTFCRNWHSKAELLAEQLRDGRGPGWKLLASKSTRSGYSAVWELPEGKRFIEVTLVQGGARSGYGYKDMESSMCPYVDDVPIEFFDMVPPRDEGEAKWREGMKERQAAKKADRAKARELLASVKIGSLVNLDPQRYNVHQVKVIEVGKRILGAANGRVYAVPKCGILSVEAA